MFLLQLDVAEFTCGLLNPLLPSRIAIAMYSWASSARPPNSILRLLDFRSLCTFRSVMTLERSLKKLEISSQSACSLGENVLCKTSFRWVVSLNQAQKCKWGATRRWHCLAHCKRWIECPGIPNFSVSVDRCLEASSRRQMHSESVSTRRFLDMAQPAKPGTNDPMPKHQILRSCGRMWNRRRRTAFGTCHITLSPNTVPFSFRKLVCFTSVRPCHKPSQTPFFHGSLVPRLFHIDSKSGFKA